MSLPAKCPYCGASAMQPPVLDPPEERITYPCGTVVWSVRGSPWRDGNGRQSDRCREAQQPIISGGAQRGPL